MTSSDQTHKQGMATASGVGPGPPNSIADAAYVSTFLAGNMLDADELGSLLLRLSPDEHTCAWFEERRKRHICATEQDALFAMMKRMSQCDSCGEIAVDKPMLTCGACRGIHYCSKICQKNNWPQHKTACKGGQVAKSSYRVADICSKMMTAMSMMDSDTGAATSVTNHMLSSRQSGNKEFVYCAVYEDGNVIFIPMPESVFLLVNLEGRHSTTAEIDSMLHEKDVIILIVAIGTTDPDGVLNCLLLTKKTWVMANGPP